MHTINKPLVISRTLLVSSAVRPLVGPSEVAAPFAILLGTGDGDLSTVGAASVPRLTGERRVRDAIESFSRAYDARACAPPMCLL